MSSQVKPTGTEQGVEALVDNYVASHSLKLTTEERGQVCAFFESSGVRADSDDVTVEETYADWYFDSQRERELDEIFKSGGSLDDYL